MLSDQELKRGLAKLDPLMTRVAIAILNGNPEAAHEILDQWPLQLAEEQLPTDPRELALSELLDVRTATQLSLAPPAGLEALYVADLFAFTWNDIAALPNIGVKTAQEVMHLRNRYYKTIGKTEGASPPARLPAPVVAE